MPKQHKKMLTLDILEILRKYSDENHRLTQGEIQELLLSEYEMNVERKAVRQGLTDLIGSGYNIEYETQTRKTGDTMSRFYLERDFTGGELHLLIDSILFFKYIPTKQRRDLVEKLAGLSNQYFKTQVQHALSIPESPLQDPDFFYTIEVLEEAITKGKQVSFYYGKYNEEKKLCHREEESGVIRLYPINPYQIAVAGDKYYLICNHNEHDDVGIYRVDRIRNIQIMEQPVKPMQQVKGLEKGLNLSKFMAEHIYMFSGPSATVTFRIQKAMVPEMIDWFGKEITFFDETDTEISGKVYVNLMAMRKWAVQYALSVKVLTPPALVEEIKADLREALSLYEDKNAEQK